MTIFPSKELLLEKVLCDSLKAGTKVKVRNEDKVEVYTVVQANEEDQEFQDCVLKFEKSIDLIQK